MSPTSSTSPLPEQDEKRGLRRTPLYATHQRAGARLVEFGGWEMPVQYVGIMDEHLAVRQTAGLFDISHMGEIRLSGEGALTFLNQTLTNDLGRLEIGQGQYTLMANASGGVVDDLYVYRIGPATYLLVVNASRIPEDIAWLGACLRESTLQAVTIEDVSDTMGALALQGPAVSGFIDRAFSTPSLQGIPVANPTALRKNELASFEFAGEKVWVARTGYTGEDGFELIAPSALLESLWSVLIEDGERHGLIPCGLGARDTLRTEMGYPLYGHELNAETSPIEAGLGGFVNLNKGPFIGREVLARQKAEGVTRRCVGFTMTDRSPPPRHGYEILDPTQDQTPVGVVTSGTLSPSLRIGIGLGYVPVNRSQPGTELALAIRNRPFPAVVVKKPLYRKPV